MIGLHATMLDLNKIFLVDNICSRALWKFLYQKRHYFNSNLLAKLSFDFCWRPQLVKLAADLNCGSSVKVIFAFSGTVVLWWGNLIARWSRGKLFPFGLFAVKPLLVSPQILLWGNCQFGQIPTKETRLNKFPKLPEQAIIPGPPDWKW